MKSEAKKKRRRPWTTTWFAGYQNFREEVTIMYENDKHWLWRKKFFVMINSYTDGNTFILIYCLQKLIGYTLTIFRTVSHVL